MSEINPIVRKMRAALTTYHKKALETDKKIAQMKNELLPDVAQERIRSALAELNGAKLTAIDQITEAVKEGKAAAAQGWKISSADLDQADSALLKSGIKLKQDEFDDLCRKYQNNATMSRLLANYADQINQAAGKNTDNMLFTPCLSSPEKKAEVWDRLDRSANMIISNISQNRGFTTGADNPFVISSVEGFGLNTEV